MMKPYLGKYVATGDDFGRLHIVRIRVEDIEISIEMEYRVIDKNVKANLVANFTLPHYDLNGYIFNTLEELEKIISDRISDIDIQSLYENNPWVKERIAMYLLAKDIFNTHKKGAFTIPILGTSKGVQHLLEIQNNYPERIYVNQGYMYENKEMTTTEINNFVTKDEVSTCAFEITILLNWIRYQYNKLFKD